MTNTNAMVTECTTLLESITAAAAEITKLSPLAGQVGATAQPHLVPPTAPSSVASRAMPDSMKLRIENKK